SPANPAKTMKLRAKYKIERASIKRAKDKLKSKRRKVPNLLITVGIHEAEGSQEKVGYDGQSRDASLLRVALVHEFGKRGKRNIPSRSFLRSWFDSNIARFKREFFDAVRAEYNGASGAVDRQAEDWAEELRAWITENGEFEPLSLRTQKQRTN